MLMVGTSAALDPPGVGVGAFRGFRARESFTASPALLPDRSLIRSSMAPFLALVGRGLLMSSFTDIMGGCSERPVDHRGSSGTLVEGIPYYNTIGIFCTFGIFRVSRMFVPENPCGLPDPGLGFGAAAVVRLARAGIFADIGGIFPAAASTAMCYALVLWVYSYGSYRKRKWPTAGGASDGGLTAGVGPSIPPYSHCC